MSIYTEKFNTKLFEDNNTSMGKIVTLVNPKTQKVLDVGCASGYLGSFLKKKYNCKVWGIEIDKNDFRKALKKLNKVLNVDIESNIDFKKINTKFDTIIFADILEHLKDPQVCLNKFLTKLTHQGEIIASIPNITNYNTKLMLFNGNWKYEDFGLMDKTHKTFFNYDNIINLFEKNGLYIEKIDYVRSNVPISILVGELIKSGIEINSTIMNNFFSIESDIFQYIIKATTIRPKNYISYIENKKNIVGKLTITSKDEIKKVTKPINNTMSRLLEENTQLKQELNTIRTSKTFIYWQKFNDLKKLFKKKND
jgi:2-polyprenyl-3-methyl-5-hydroxy-6-metoxy-1,4-benzoquinol methylase